MREEAGIVREQWYWWNLGWSCRGWPCWHCSGHCKVALQPGNLDSKCSSRRRSKRRRRKKKKKKKKVVEEMRS